MIMMFYFVFTLFIVIHKGRTIFRQSLRALDRVSGFTKGSGPLSSQFLSFLLPLSQNFGVFSSSLTILLGALAFNSHSLTLPLQHDGSYETLDLGCFELGFLSLLDGERPLDHVIADIVVLLKVKQLADLGGTLRSQTTGNGGVSKSGDFVISLLLNDNRNDGQVSIDNATTDRLAFTLTSTALTIARVSLGQEKTDSSLGEDTLFHGKTLLVVSTGNTENVTSPFIAKGGSIDLLAHTLLVEGTNLNFIVNLEKLLAARSWIRHVYLHIVSITLSFI